MPSYYIIAAFAAFLFHPTTRTPAFFILIVEMVGWRLEDLNSDGFKVYYLAVGLVSAVSSLMLVKRYFVHSCLVFAVLCNAFIGYVLYIYYLPPTTYNFIGYCIIITQLTILAKDASGGELRRCFDDVVVRIRYNLGL